MAGTETAKLMSGVDLPAGAIRGTVQQPWRLLSAAAAEDDPNTISLTDGESLTEVASADLIDLSEIFGNSFDQLILAMFSSPDDSSNNPDGSTDGGDTFGFDLVGYRSDGRGKDALTFNPAHMICRALPTGGIVGTQTVDGITNGLWVDSITLNFDDWIGDAQVYDHGNNRIAMIVCDPMGLRYLRFHRYAALGANGGEAPTVGLIGTVIGH